MDLVSTRLCVRTFFAAALMMVTGITAAHADEVMASRLGALLGQERQAIAVIPSARVAALTTPPAPETREIPTAPLALTYDDAMLAALPTPTGDAQWECLSQALYFEARGESVRGIFAVGEVILNRVDSGAYPGSICNVINQGTGAKFRCQFSYTCDGRAEEIHEPAAFDRVAKVARLLLDGAPRDLTDGATHYHTQNVNPSWARRFPQTASIGSHVFYRQPTRTAMN